MTIFDVLTMLGGLCLFLFGMNVMGDGLERRAGSSLKALLSRLTDSKIKGFLTGLGVTAVIQSSSATTVMVVGFVNSRLMTLKQSIGVIMGANIGTCVTALLSSFGANKNAKRAAYIHLSFNVIGTAVWLTVFALISKLLQPALLDASATYLGIAVCHSVFNILCTALLLPMSGLLERIAYLLVPEGKESAKAVELDQRLLATPSIALGQCHNLVLKMAEETLAGTRMCLRALLRSDLTEAEKIRVSEKTADHYEDVPGTFLTKLARAQISDDDSSEVSKLLKVIGDLERISDHSVNILESAEEMAEKKIVFSDGAKQEIEVLCRALTEVLGLTVDALRRNDREAAGFVEPLEQVIDHIKSILRNRHITRLKKGECSVEAGFIWADLLTDIERTSDHCSNIAVSIIDAHDHNMNAHEAMRSMKKGNPAFLAMLDDYARKYQLP